MNHYLNFITASEFCEEHQISNTRFMYFIRNNLIEYKKINRHYYIPIGQQLPTYKRNQGNFPVGDVRQKVRELAVICNNASQIAAQLNVSRQWISEIAHKDGLRVFFKGKAKSKECPICHNTFKYHNKFCSKKCYVEYVGQVKEARKLTRQCVVCKNTFKISPYRMRPERGSPANFCSKKCQGRYAGNKYGFKAHPENAVRHILLRKYDYEKVWQIHQETGYGALRLSRLLNIPSSTVSAILFTLKNERAGFKPSIRGRYGVKNISSITP